MNLNEDDKHKKINKNIQFYITGPKKYKNSALAE